MTVIAEVFYQDGDFARGSEVELVAFEIESVFVSPKQVGDQVFVSWAIVEDFNVLGRLNEQLGECGSQSRRTKKKESRNGARDSSTSPRAFVRQVLQCSEGLIFFAWS